jgi:hypothetical protein
LATDLLPSTFLIGSPKRAIQSSGVVPRAGVTRDFKKAVSIAVPAIEGVRVETSNNNADFMGFIE